MNIDNFMNPDSHPFDMLKGYDRAYEKEAVLQFILRGCIDYKDITAPISTRYDHPTMVEDGLLEEVAERMYRLTKKSIGLLYSVYGI